MLHTERGGGWEGGADVQRTQSTTWNTTSSLSVPFPFTLSLPPPPPPPPQAPPDGASQKSPNQFHLNERKTRPKKNAAQRISTAQSALG